MNKFFSLIYFIFAVTTIVVGTPITYLVHSVALFMLSASCMYIHLLVEEIKELRK